MAGAAGSAGAETMQALEWLGLCLAAGGAAWAAWAWWCLRLAHPAVRPGARPTVLVEEGPYRLGRHPMYLGIAVAWAGAALLSGSLPTAVAGAVWAGAVARVQVPREEQRLRQVFGGWYSDYAGSVRRWL